MEVFMRWSSLLAGSMYTIGAICAENTKPNIIFYLADDLGYGQWDNVISQTPNLHLLASQGTIMDRTITEPVCGPSRYAIMSGTNRQKANAENGKVPYPKVTLASYFNSQGYATGMFGKDGLYPQTAPFNETLIYRTHEDSWEGFPVVLDNNGNLERHNVNRKADKKRCRKISQKIADVEAESIATKPLSKGRNRKRRKVNCRYAPYMFSIRRNNFIRKHAGKRPFFVYHSDPRPHVLKWNVKHKSWSRQCPVLDYGPYAKKWPWAPKPFNQRLWNDNQRGFVAMIWGLDQDIASLMSVLRETGQENNTIIFFTSDNGPQLMFDEPFDLYGLKGKKRDTWENGIRNQAILWKPGLFPAGIVNHCPWKVRDLLGSLTSIVGNRYIPEGSIDVSAVWLDESKCSEVYKHKEIIDVEYCENDEPCKWAHYDMHLFPAKLLKFVNSGTGPELYDVLSDEREEHNLVGSDNYTDYIAETYNHNISRTRRMLRASI